MESFGRRAYGLADGEIIVIMLKWNDLPLWVVQHHTDTTLCFLVVDKLWLAALSSCCLDFPSVKGTLNCKLK